MAKKKKSVVKKKGSVRRAVARPALRRPVASSGTPDRQRRFRLVVRNLITFAILFVLFLILEWIATDPFYDDLFWILAVLTGFVAVAFLIALLVFVFMRIFKKY